LRHQGEMVLVTFAETKVTRPKRVSAGRKKLKKTV